MDADIGLMLLENAEEVVAGEAGRVVVLKVGYGGIFGGGAIEADNAPPLFAEIAGRVAANKARHTSDKNSL